MSHLSRWRTVADVMCHFKLPWKCPLTSEVWLHQHIRLKLRYIKYRLSLLCGSFIFIIPWLYKTGTFVAVYNIAVHLLCSINLWLLVFYFYQILNAFNKLKMTSEAVLLLPNIRHRIWYCFDNYFTYFVPVFKYCYSDSRNLWTVMRAGGLAP